MSPGMPICRIVSQEDMFVQSEVSEKYVGKFKVGDSVNIEIPAIAVITAFSYYSYWKSGQCSKQNI